MDRLHHGGVSEFSGRELSIHGASEASMTCPHIWRPCAAACDRGAFPTDQHRRDEMCALGHKQTSRHVRVMSVSPPKADIRERTQYVCFVP